MLKLGFIPKKPQKSMITFELRYQQRFPSLEKFIADSYKRLYPTLHIKKIILKPTSGKIIHIDSTECTSPTLKNALQNRNGSFVLSCKKHHYFFRYQIVGKITVYKANHQIKRDKIISLKDLVHTTIPFVRFYSPPIARVTDGHYIASQMILKNQTITDSKLKLKPMLFKHQYVRCYYKEGFVRIEFDAKTMQSGYIGDNILVKNAEGKIFHGIIMKNKTVEIR